MSTIVLQPKVFASVMVRLQHLATKCYPYDICRVFNKGYHPDSVAWLDLMDETVSDFIYRLYRYNNITSTLNRAHGTFDEVSKALYDGDKRMEAEKEYIANIEPKDITDLQCYMFLQCIDYNIDLEGWDGATYYSEDFMAQYKADIGMLHEIAGRMAEHFAMKLAEKEGCKWAEL